MKSNSVFSMSLILVLCISATTHAALVNYNVDFGDVPVNGHSLRVAGTIEAETSTGQIVTSNLGLIHTDLVCTPFGCEVQVRSAALSGPVPNSNTIAGEPIYHWLATPTELRFFGDSPNWFGGILVSWRGSAGGIEDSYFSMDQSSAGLNLRAAYETRSHGHSVTGPLTDASAGLLIGTAAVPEPSTGMLACASIVLLGLLIAGRRRFGFVQ